MGKSYKIVFNSDIADSGSNGFQQFFYDWSQIEEGQYKCSFSMISAVGSTPTFNVIPSVFMDLGQSNTLIAKPFNTGSFGASYMLPSFIGTLGVNNIQNDILDPVPTAVYCFADLEDNPPFYLQKRPPNNFINVGVYITRGSPFPSIYNPPLIGRYTLSLHLEKLD